MSEVRARTLPIALVVLVLLLGPWAGVSHAHHLMCGTEYTTSPAFDGTNSPELNKLGLTTREVSNWLGGADGFSAQGGNDLVCMGSGADTVNGNDGVDNIHGGPDADTINGGPDGDVLREELGGGSADGDCGNDNLYDGDGVGELMTGGECGESGSGDWGFDCDDGGTGEIWLEFEGTTVPESANC